MYTSLKLSFISHSLMIDYLGCLLSGVTINTAGDILVQEYWSVFTIVSFLDQTPRRGICGSKGRTRKLLRCLAMLPSAKAPAVDTAQPLCSASWVPRWVYHLGETAVAQE